MKPAVAEPRPVEPVQIADAPTPAPLPEEPIAPSAPRPAVPVFTRPPSSSFRPALFVVLLTVLIAAAALVLLYRYRQPDSIASSVPTVETPSPAAVPQQPATDQTASAIPDLSGNWNVVNTVEQTSYHAYKNMRVGFNVSINQTGKDFTGKGQKISENGQSIPVEDRTPIEVRGTIDGDKVEATFSESGALRKTNGRFVWRMDKTNGGLTGTFFSNAARSRGKSAATKQL